MIPPSSLWTPYTHPNTAEMSLRLGTIFFTCLIFIVIKMCVLQLQKYLLMGHDGYHHILSLMTENR